MSRATERIGKFSSQSYLTVIAIVAVVTLIMVYAITAIEPNTDVESFQSDSQVYRAQKRYEDTFRPSYHGIPMVFVAKDGNILTMDNLHEVVAAFEAASDDPETRSWSFNSFEPNIGANMSSFASMADEIKFILDERSPLFFHEDLRSLREESPDITFDSANDGDLSIVLDLLFNITDESGNHLYQNLVSSDLERSDGHWRASIMMAFPYIDNEKFEERYTYEVAGDDDKEYFEVYDIRIIDTMSEDLDDVELYGVGVGINDEIEKEITASGPIIMLAFIVIIIVLISSLKEDMKCFTAAAVGLPLVIIWMLGTARLLRLGDTQFTALLPVLIMALGIDYAIHSMKRFREEINRNRSPREAVKRSVEKLGGTLALAMLTTVVAFLSTQLSTIPALKDWGVEAGLAIVWAFVIMGIFVPSLRLAMDGKYKDMTPKERQKIGKKKDIRSKPSKIGRGLKLLGRRTSGRSGITLLVVFLITIPLAYGAMKLDSEFDVKEYFDNESDFVIGMDHYMDSFPTGGEPTILLIEGDIGRPEVIMAIDETRDNLLARGYAAWYIPDAAYLVRNFTRNLDVNNMIGFVNIAVTDENDDGIPDNQTEVEEVLTQLTTVGLWGWSNGTPVMIHAPFFLQEVIHFDEDEQRFDMTNMQIGIPDSGSLNSIRKARDNIEEDARPIEETGHAEFILTGEPVVRNDQLTAISDSMKYSMIASVIICFTILLAVFRRVAFSVIAILPVILIGLWLYGSMYYLGYSLNIVTATIGAMSIGVGVDFSIHISDRYKKEREEEGRGFKKAMDNTLEHSGSALFFSTMTTALGFLMLLLAPMPMFLSFGLFSALMVLLAFASSVLVLPPLIKMLEGKKSKEKRDAEGKKDGSRREEIRQKKSKRKSKTTKSTAPD